MRKSGVSEKTFGSIHLNHFNLIWIIIIANIGFENMSSWCNRQGKGSQSMFCEHVDNYERSITILKGININNICQGETTGKYKGSMLFTPWLMDDTFVQSREVSVFYIFDIFGNINLNQLKTSPKHWGKSAFRVTYVPPPPKYLVNAPPNVLDSHCRDTLTLLHWWWQDTRFSVGYYA